MERESSDEATGYLASIIWDVKIRQIIRYSFWYITTYENMNKTDIQLKRNEKQKEEGHRV